MNLQNASTGLYLDDLSVGQKFSSASLSVTADAIKSFAGLANASGTGGRRSPSP